MQNLAMLVTGCVVFGFCLSAMVLHSLGLPRDAALARALTTVTTLATAFLSGFLTWLIIEGFWQRAVAAGLAYGVAAAVGVLTEPNRRPFGAMVSASGWIVLPLPGYLVIHVA